MGRNFHVRVKSQSCSWTFSLKYSSLLYPCTQIAVKQMKIFTYVSIEALSKDFRHSSLSLDTQPNYAQPPLGPYGIKGQRKFVCLVSREPSDSFSLLLFIFYILHLRSRLANNKFR
jgi:hypothetical protein